MENNTGEGEGCITTTKCIFVLEENFTILGKLKSQPQTSQLHCEKAFLTFISFNK